MGPHYSTLYREDRERNPALVYTVDVVTMEVFFLTTKSNISLYSHCQPVPSIAIVTESDAKQGKQHYKRKLLLRFTVIIGFYSWVGGSKLIADVSPFVRLKEMFCVLVCHRRITVDSEDEVTLFRV